jgi:PadR family transcriptional regulator, regulatory protein PadR
VCDLVLYRNSISVYDSGVMYTSQDDRDLYGGLIRLHVLHHASEQPLYGHWMIEELCRHGYEIGPGTMYPLLHGLERKGYLRSVRTLTGSRYRKVYRITPDGRRALKLARRRVRELFGEMFSSRRTF